MIRTALTDKAHMLPWVKDGCLGLWNCRAGCVDFGLAGHYGPLSDGRCGLDEKSKHGDFGDSAGFSATDDAAGPASDFGFPGEDSGN
jgi:hypothetical protein